MQKSMLMDLNVLIDTTVSFKTKYLYCRTSYAENRHARPCAVRQFLVTSLWRHAVIELHKLVGTGENDYFSLWKFWDRIEAGYYPEEVLPKHTLDGWRQLLHLWSDEMEVVKRLHAKYTGHPVAPAGSELFSFSLEKMEGMLWVIEFIVLAMFNPVARGNFTYLGTVFDEQVAADILTPVQSAGDAAVVRMTFPAA